MNLPFFHSKVVQAIVKKFTEHMEKRQPDIVIGGVENPYLCRWYVIPRNKWFKIYYHHFCRSDDDRALHDNPWWNMSLVLSHPGYHEVLPKVKVWNRDGEILSMTPEDIAYLNEDRLAVAPTGELDYQNTYAIYRYPGDMVFRKAESAHRVRLFAIPYGVDEKGDMVLPPGRYHHVKTLFITGPKIRDWGFHCPQGWKHWQKFTSFETKGDSTTVGPGCNDE